MRCHGSGSVTCSTCHGARSVRHFQRLTVTWSNVVAVEILEGTELPDHLLRNAEGREVLSEEDFSISPVQGGTSNEIFREGPLRVNREVNRIANALIERHRFPQDTRLHRQRLTVHAVPVYRAEYRWGKGTRCFFVYGKGRVHAPSYPLSPPRLAALILCLAGLSGAVVALAMHLSR